MSRGRQTMNPAEVVGSIGVAILLLAFFLNLIGVLGRAARSYLAMNFIGAGLACAASALIGFAPFVVLEATWGLMALVGLIRTARWLRGRMFRSGRAERVG